MDALAGFVDDVGADRGMLITSGGYTQAALKRAYYGPSNLELDILNFSELQQFQGFEAIPYAGEKGFLVAAPFGWIIDATRTQGRLANMYQRGLDLASAMRKREFLYVNGWDRKSDPLTAVELDEYQVAGMRLYGPVTVSHRRTVQRPDAVTRLRIAEVKEYKCLEVTGFVEFDDVIFFAVLLTPSETQRSNIRRLESVLRQVVPIDFKRDNSALIFKIRKQLEQKLHASQRVGLLRELGHWYRNMGQFEDARHPLEESLSLDRDNGYHTIKELLPVLVKLGDRSRAKEVMNDLLRLDPHNPTVFNDCFTFARGWIERNELLTIIDTLKAEYPDDRFVQANCDFYAGNLLISDDPASARKRLIAARQTFRYLFPNKHQVFRELRIALKLCPEDDR